MNRMTRLLAMVLLAAAVAVPLSSVSPPEACACTCATASVSETVAQADLIAHGTVVTVTQSTDLHNPVAVTVRLDMLYSGHPGGTLVVVHTGTGEGDCGRVVAVGDTIMIFATQYEGTYNMNDCFGQGVTADDVVAITGPGTPMTDTPTSSTPTSSTPTSSTPSTQGEGQSFTGTGSVKQWRYPLLALVMAVGTTGAVIVARRRNR